MARVLSVAIQPDGKTVLAGSSLGGDFAVARLNSDGTVDEGFGQGGLVTTDFGADFGFNEARAVAIQASGSEIKILAAGESGNGDFALVRLNRDGSFDPTFGVGGWVTTDFRASGDRATSLAIQRDGKIVAAGAAAESVIGHEDFALARYDSRGVLDATFGVGGKVITEFVADIHDFANGVTIQTDGKIVAAGGVVSGVIALARYNTDGSLDAAYGSGGKVLDSTVSRATDIAIQPDDKIVAAVGELVRYLP